jgi:hypothetical protein
VRGSVIIIVLLIPENTGSSQEMQLEPWEDRIFLGFSFASFSTLKTEVICSSETCVDFYGTKDITPQKIQLFEILQRVLCISVSVPG